MKFKLGLRVEKQTVQLWGWALSIGAVLMALAYWNVVPFTPNAGALNAFVMFLMAATAISEVAFGKGGFEIKKTQDSFPMLVSVLLIMAGLSFLGMPIIPPQLSMLVGVFYIVGAFTTLYSVYK